MPRKLMMYRNLSLVIFTSRFEATRELFLDVPRNFEPRSDDEDDTRAGIPSPNFRTPAYELTCNRPHTRRIFNGNRLRTWNPPAPKTAPYRDRDMLGVKKL
ncbi:hypothetical protein AVEN_136953-1 [Araneus ventricosus]|uniref:Uncharacterized protein n=1 Tax=Araneus ventricosus TaxID=182803 RepID=A0A4Y2BGT5_ARAVE|nr:hypothetical protein AVEN_136953-1 [Araneus ventricosus]